MDGSAPTNQTANEGHVAQWRSMSRSELELFVRSLMVAYEVVGVQEQRGRLTLDRVADPARLMLDYPPQVHSPKKFLFPNWEKLFRFRLDGGVLLEPEKAAMPRVVFGMHTCDLHAVDVLDQCLFEGEEDSAYRAKREATILIGTDCQPDDKCFCDALGTDRMMEGFDLFLHRVEEGYLVRSGSGRGLELLKRHAPAVAARPEEAPLPLQARQCPSNLPFPVESLPHLLEEVYDHPVWRELGERCLGCGACTLLCPTCYCFNVQDNLDLNLEGGERVRTWDSCQFDQFTRVASGENFRADQADRQRHRFFRKYKYLWDRHQRTACVGCGRCSRECLAGIDPVEVLSGLFRQQALPEPDPTQVPGNEYQPQLAEIRSAERLTGTEVLFRLRLPRPIRFEPGAFVQLSVFGLGEAPFTIASAPEHGDEIEVVVRGAGTLTQSLHRLRPGDTVGIRGPFGTGFPIAAMEGQDVLLVAGGMGLITMRSLLLALLEHRERFGRVMLLYGAREVEALLFRRELLDWHREGLIDCRFAVAEEHNAWGVPRGDVTLLFKELEVNPARTVAAVSGPAGMYRFVNPLLFRLGFGEQQLYLNLERHMKCGLGKCGKCRINDLCVCECGPIFSYARIKHLKEAIER